jgi:hypothetical protein
MMLSTPRFMIVAAAAVALSAAPLRAQSDEETLSRYRLTDAALAKFVQASRNFIAVAKANPALLKEGEDDGEHAQTLAQIAAVYDRHPPLQKAITGAGLTTREYVTFVLAMFQAGMAAMLVEHQQGKFDNVPAGIPRDNALFYQRHKVELERIGEELRALEGKERSQEGDPPAGP